MGTLCVVAVLLYIRKSDLLTKNHRFTILTFHNPLAVGEPSLRPTAY
jgi:hypothetical protein